LGSDNKEDEEIESICDEMRYTDYFTPSTNLLRSDILKFLLQGHFNASFVYDSDGRFPIMGYSFDPTGELAEQIQRVLDDHGYNSGAEGMPLREL